MNTVCPVLASGWATWLLATAYPRSGGRHLDGYDIAAVAMILITLWALRRLRDQG